MYYQPLENVFSSAQVNPPHSAEVVQVFIPALQHLAASAQQPLSPLPSNPTAIRIYRLPLAILSFPALPSALWLAEALIDVRLPVGASGNGEDMPYWPSYSDIPPSSRYAYLRWLSGGRRDQDARLGLVSCSSTDLNAGRCQRRAKSRKPSGMRSARKLSGCLRFMGTTSPFADTQPGFSAS